MVELSLLDRIASVKVRIQRQEEARQLETDADKLSDRARSLRSAAQAAATATDTSALLLEHGTEVEWDRDSLRSLRSRVTRFAERSRSSAAALLEPNAQLWPSLDAFPEDVNARLLMAWQAWVDRSFPARDESALATLQRIPELQEGVRRIRQGLTIRTQRRASIPTSSADFDAVLEAATATDQAWSELVGAGLPAGVPEFLDAAGLGQATLEQFTDVVRAWFERKGLQHLIRLSVVHRGTPPK